MSIRRFVMCIAIAGAFGACATTPPEPREDEQQPDLTTVTVPAELTVPPITNAQACQVVTCGPEFGNCRWIGDFDCDEEFCRVPGDQCEGKPSTFIRVQHVFSCRDNAGNTCISLTVGRRLVHCGC
jgi:hypothetical protein